MKTTNRFGGKKLIGPITIVCLIWFNWGCNNQQNDIRTVLKDSKTGQGWINSKYIKQKPLAQLINIGTFCDTSCTFELSKPGEVQIYAVGELVYQLANVKPEYFFKGDDIEIFIRKKLKEGLDSLMKWNFSWADHGYNKSKINVVKYGVALTRRLKIDSITSKYLVSIKIPWGVLGIKNPRGGTEIPFDSAIGDNDDDYKQKAKISMFSITDLLDKANPDLGRIILSNNNVVLNTGTNIIYSSNYKLSNDTDLIKCWKSLPAYEIKHLVMGTVKDKYDLSAKMKSCWDKKSLNLYFEIQDYNRKRIDPSKIRELQTFLDYAWIEDVKGKKVWEMHELDSSPAGGAIKNRKVDMHIKLEPGKYTLYYTSDESHAFNNWDDSPPKTPFYGVVLYAK